MIKNYLKFVMFVEIVCYSKSEWIKITQDSSGLSSVKKETNFNTENYLSSILDPKQRHEVPPSQEWIDYQKFRFAMGENAQKITISGSDNLKNSAKIVVPIRNLEKTNLNSSEEKLFEPDSAVNNMENVNQVIQFDVKLPIKSDKPTTESPPPVSVVNEGHLLHENAEMINEKRKSTRRKDTQDEFEAKKMKTPSISGFLEFLRSLQTSLISKTKNGILDKINKLSKLRDRLLLNIEDRIKALWPPKQTKRPKRGIFDETQSNFPTAETALMTINFLTFAVFLIKLVLQVINTIKSKHYNFNGFSVNTMEAIQLAKSKQNARNYGDSESDLENTEKILKSVKKLPN